MPSCAEEQVSWIKPRRVNCADLTPPPTVGRPSSTTQRKPAFDKYAAVTRLLCPAPATTISKRSGVAAVCRAMVFSGESARGASAAPFTNPRRVIPLIPGLLVQIHFRWDQAVWCRACCPLNGLSILFALHLRLPILVSLSKTKMFRRKLKWRMIAPQSAAQSFDPNFGPEGAMRFPLVVTALAFSLALLVVQGAVPAQAQTAGSDADTAAITQVCADFSQNFSRHDAHGVAMTF